MTACAFDTALTGGVGDRPRGGFTIASDRSYGARLALSEEACCWYPERWTLDGPEPYAVPLPAAQPEEPDCELLPLADGQVLIHRRVAGHHAFSLLYPAGPGTGERSLGGIDRAEVSLLPPAPGGLCAFALGRGPRSTSVWLVAGGGVLVPQHLAEVPGRCTGGSWLDRTGRLLALDRELDGRTKTVVVDLRRGGETSPLLQITERSDDRLLLADPDSGLLLVRSDAPGEERLGWGVLGSTRPVRFPDCLRPAGWSEATPFAVQPGQVLTPEACAVAFRVDGRGGAGRPWVGVWRPAERRLREFPAPEGWLPGAGLWTRDGELRLPYATPQVPCGVARVRPSGVPGAAASRLSGGSWVPAAGGAGAAWVAEVPEGSGGPSGASGGGSGGASGGVGAAGAAIGTSGGALSAPRAAEPSGAPESPWRPDDSTGSWRTDSATETWPPDSATGAWPRDEATGSWRTDSATGAWPRGDAAGSWRTDSATGAWPRGDAAGSWRPDEATGARRIARVTRVLSEPSGRVAEEHPGPGPGPAGARDVQTPRTTSPAAEIATRITPWARVGGPGGSDPARTPGLTPLRPPGPAPELRPSRTAGPTPELRPSRTAGLAPSRTPAPEPVPVPVRERSPMPVRESVPVRMPESEGGSGVEPWGGTGSWAGVEQEMGPEPDSDPGSGTGPALRPVPLQQAPLARPPEPRPPRWVRDHRRG
ncbi:hypothetical protein [Streptomyces violaceusniger]|uniref:Uncharacterized protein n=1 Tax=Streptomyces violaceusniger (strain Tu 4113) TaxID=653045 RepID=G2P6S9_STRV4|nr:hypothetical protein Strvi_7389 [Streptomyces violaceusniger Tu 4113]